MKLSVIIPTIGRPTLPKVLRALLANEGIERLDVEVLVVFDNVAPMHDPVFQDPRIRTIRTPDKRYAGGARNLGIEESHGEILFFLSDDTIPESHFLMRHHAFHHHSSDREFALLGRIHWADHLGGDPFHKWLGEGAHFDYANLDKGRTPTWRHFYTSNISLKRSLLENERFNTSFSGWGFEDIELGYRLTQKGMILHYDDETKVTHDDDQTVSMMIERTKQARQNAKIFESLHPEVKILPGGIKLWVLKFFLFLAGFVTRIPQVHWWYEWKKAWITPSKGS